MSAVLDGLSRRPFCDFLKFCAALISVEQTAVIVELLSPEVQADNNSISSCDTTTDAMPADAPQEVHVQPGYKWRDVMRQNFTILTHKVDPDTGLFEILRSRGVISDWNIDIFKVCVSFLIVVSGIY